MATPMIAWAKLAEKVNWPEFVTELAAIASRLGWDPSWLFTHLKKESGFLPRANNPTAAGLGQWTKSTIKGLVDSGVWPKGVTREAILASGWREQLVLLELYLQQYKDKVKSAGDMRLVGWGLDPNKWRDNHGAIFASRSGKSSLGSGEKAESASRRRYALNTPADTNGDGYITVGELWDAGEKSMAEGLGAKWQGEASKAHHGGLGLLIAMLLAAGAGYVYYKDKMK